MMILRSKAKPANYSIDHELNNRVEHRLRLSAYIFDEEGCVYQDKTASKTPLDVTKMRALFRPNPMIKNTKYVDNKEERKREETRQHMKVKYRGGYHKEIKMGEILMHPYYWCTNEDKSTPIRIEAGWLETKETLDICPGSSTTTTSVSTTTTLLKNPRSTT